MLEHLSFSLDQVLECDSIVNRVAHFVPIPETLSHRQKRASLPESRQSTALQTGLC